MGCSFMQPLDYIKREASNFSGVGWTRLMSHRGSRNSDSDSGFRGLGLGMDESESCIQTTELLSISNGSFMRLLRYKHK